MERMETKKLAQLMHVTAQLGLDRATSDDSAALDARGQQPSQRGNRPAH
jgi:hypothetical protein